MIKRCQGFSLLEVLVAFAILGISLGVLLQIFSTALQAAKLSEEYAYATTLAQSKLAAIGTVVPYQEGVREGAFSDKYAWRTTIQPYKEAKEAEVKEGLGAVMNAPISLYQVVVEVSWKTADKRRSVVLKTLRLVAKQPSS